MDSLVVEEVLAEVAQVEDGKMIFNQQEKQHIESLIKEVEHKSSAELVAVITRKSSHYQLLALFVSLLFMASISLILIVLTTISTQMLLMIQVITLCGSYFVLESKTALLLFLIPKALKYQTASKVANDHFQKLGLHLTQTKQAIMFFVSIEEKYVEIITDSKIKEQIKDELWQEIVNAFIKDVQNKNIYQGYARAIQSCGTLLIEKFPIKADDINELSNEIIEIKMKE